MSKRVVVLALGGNAIQPSTSKGSFEEQYRNVDITAAQIADLIKRNYKVVITHGNGPQVGNLMVQQESATPEVPAQPLAICGAMTQGQIGYMLQSRLAHHLYDNCGLQSPVTTLVTRVAVDPNDPAFKNPTKPIGAFFTKEEAEELKKTRGYDMIEAAPEKEKSWRRVVYSPKPVEIVEAEVISHLLDNHVVVISCGGGGIPVVKQEDGSFKNVEAVIDKDLTACLLAKQVDADYLMILTDVEKVAINWGKPDQKDLDKLSPDEAQKLHDEGQFPGGSMGPKVLASADFVRWGGNASIITSLDKAKEALNQETGTWFVDENRVNL